MTPRALGARNRELRTDARVGAPADEPPPFLMREVATGHGARVLLPGGGGRRPHEPGSVVVDDYELGAIRRELSVPPLPRIAGERRAELLPRLGVPELRQSV